MTAQAYVELIERLNLPQFAQTLRQAAKLI
jgi:hypothetical protein